MKKLIGKIYFKFKSNSFKSSSKVKLPYILKKCKKKDAPLIVIFSAFPRTGMTATYNYLKTLNNINAHQLFILDSFGYQKRGAYYLSEYGNFELEKAVKELIEVTEAKLRTEESIFVGTSKGGYAALYFGISLQAQTIICGAPQYYLGNYLSDVTLKKPILQSMMGNTSRTSIEFLNNLLPELIKEGIPTEVYIHYSSKEHTYVEHIDDLISDMKNSNYLVHEDEQFYEIHQEVSKYFPAFLVQTLEKKLEKFS